MISIDLGSHHFQMRASAVIVHDQQVLLHRLQGDAFWALPGGRVEPGEDAAHTVRRELLEEAGLTVDCHRLVLLIENFFSRADKPAHELGLYFLASLPDASAWLDKGRAHLGVEPDKRLQFQWFPLAELPSLDLRPALLRTALQLPGLPFQHRVQRPVD
jgi:8-oxo-dGTP pyrophosphatase MutT (NUDIX family)